MRHTLTILLILALFGCVEEIEFNASGETGTLVVDGLISTAGDSNLIYLTRTNDLNKQIFPPETAANILLFDDLQQSAQYQDLGNGKYFLIDENIKIEPGHVYHIEITTVDGQKYISDPEVIVSAPPIDSLTFDFSIEEKIERENRVLEKSFFNLYVGGEIPGTSANTYLKWDVEHIYQVAEITCNPLVAPKVCYIKRKINQNELHILNGEDYTNGAAYHVPVVHQELDFAFGLVASFYVSQKSLTKQAFQYWETVQQILTNGNTVFDRPPAAIKGNLHCVTDPDQEVLGYFSAVDEQKRVILITRGDLIDPFYELPLCGLNGNLPADIDFSVCCNCRSLENSSLMRPTYWP